jgi:MoaA/NifB/PqqE/SkfB family radical SAM enzyme
VERPHDLLAGLDPRKRIASVFLLPDCAMACRFCASAPDFAVMSKAQAEGLLGDLAARGIDNLVLGGGEPFLWPHGLRELAERARSLGFLVQVCTSGADLPDGFERLPAFDRFILPLEAADAATHDRLRIHPGGHHRLVLARLEALVAAGRELTISTVVTRENLAGLPALAALLASLKAKGARLHAWHLYRFLPIGRAGAPNADSLDLDLRAYLDAVEAVRRANLGFPVFRRSDMRRASSVVYLWAEADGLRVAG